MKLKYYPLIVAQFSAIVQPICAQLYYYQLTRNALMLGRLKLIIRAIKTYYREYRYFVHAKKEFRTAPGSRELTIRKRAHSLERALFHPEAYSSKASDNIASELEKLLAGIRSDPPSEPVKWASKILREYRINDGQAYSMCPMIKGGTKRTPSAFQPEDVLRLMRSRRSRRVFDGALTQADKDAVCEAAQLAPSACNRQTIELLFIEDAKLKEKVASTVPGGRQFFANAPAIIVFLSNAGDYRYPDDRSTPFIDGAAAIQNIYLLAETMGLGCCWGSYTSFGNIHDEERVRSLLRIPPTYMIVGSLAIGKSSQFVCDIPRDEPQQRYWNNYYGKK